MTAVESFVNNGKGYLKGLPRSRLYLYAFFFVALVGGSVIGLSVMNRENFHTLFTGLSAEDASSIVTKLKEQKIPYKLEMGGTTISVPKEKVYDVRLSLASQNLLPGGSGVGFELFDKTNYGMTEFMQNINYKRAIQGELSRTINQMPEVKASRVHIAIPDRTLFLDREKETTASVLLKVKAGRMLSKEQISGIVHLVAGSIEGLKPENVAVIDSSGKLLYKNTDRNSPVALSGQQFELQRTVERRYEESVQSMLDRFIPANRSIVRANVELNLRKVETVEEEYSPDKRAATGEKTLREKAVNKNMKASGVPGVASNVPNPTAGKEGKQEGTERATESQREESQVSYEVSKSIKKIIEPHGDIRRISLAVVIDGKYERIKGQKGEEIKYVPRSQNELNDIRNLVARAVGSDERRGDKIEILNVPFEIDAFTDEKALAEREERRELISMVSRYAFYAAILFAVVFFVLRPLMKMGKRRPAAPPIQQPKDVYVKSDATEIRSLGDKPQNALAATMQNKALVSSIIKEWVREGT